MRTIMARRGASTRARALGAIGGLSSLTLVACSEALPGCRGEAQGDGAGSLAESAEARERLSEVRRQVVRVRSSGPVVVIGAGAVESFERTAGGRVRAVVRDEARRRASRPARVELPARASEPAYLEDEATGVAVAFAIEGARDVGITVADGIALYAGALPGGGHVAHRVSAEGTEDYAVFASRPEREELVYRVDVGRVAGLRRVGEVLEMLDGEGVPRLRVAAPYVVDATGKEQKALLTLEGCACDTDPRPPWGQAVVAPGATSCTVRVTWEGVAYPAVVDPAWQMTTAMKDARVFHRATVLSDGTVLVTGGQGEHTNALASTEIYNPTTDVWTSMSSMNTGRNRHTASVVPQGVLVAGGVDDGGATTTSVEIYKGGTWLPAAPLSIPREGHTASELKNGAVLVVGVGQVAPDTTEIYDPVADKWNDAGLVISRYFHSASVLNDGTVLVAGGFHPLMVGSGQTLASTVRYYPDSGTWVDAGTMTNPRADHRAIEVEDGGAVLVFGGWVPEDGGSSVLTSVERYDSTTGTWTPAGAIAEPRFGHTVSLREDGTILVVGGVYGAGSTSAELYYDGGVADAGSMQYPRAYHTASVLDGGTVLVAGGDGFLKTAELYLLDNGAACSAGSQCKSTFCVEGICCGSLCDGGSCLGGICQPSGTGGSDAGFDAGFDGGGDACSGSSCQPSSSSGAGGSGAGSSGASLYGCASTPRPDGAPGGAAGIAALLVVAAGRRRRGARFPP
jgi:hypothetical protein